MNKDPVCGMTLDEKTVEHKSIRENNVYYFCSVACQNEFNKNPEKYLQETPDTRRVSHYGAYCPTPGCGKPGRGLAWYFYIGLLLLLVLLLVFVR